MFTWSLQLVVQYSL